jgi:anti-anti-sigma factor
LSDKPLATVRLTGALGAGNVRMLGRRIAELIRAGHRYLVLDLSAVDDVAPICVGVFNRAVAELRQVEGTLTLRGLDRATVRRLSGAGLHPSVSLFPKA